MGRFGPRDLASIEPGRASEYWVTTSKWGMSPRRHLPATAIFTSTMRMNLSRSMSTSRDRWWVSGGSSSAGLSSSRTGSHRYRVHRTTPALQINSAGKNSACDMPASTRALASPRKITPIWWPFSLCAWYVDVPPLPTLGSTACR